MTHALLRLPTVMAKTGLSRATIYSLMRTDKFPKPVLLGKRAIGWVDSEIDDWVRDKIHAYRHEQQVKKHD